MKLGPAPLRLLAEPSTCSLVPSLQPSHTTREAEPGARPSSSSVHLTSNCAAWWGWGRPGALPRLEEQFLPWQEWGRRWGAFGPRIWPEGMRAVTGTRSGLSGGLAFPSACCHSLRSGAHGHPECSKAPACTLLCPILVHTHRTPAGTVHTVSLTDTQWAGHGRGQDTWVGRQRASHVRRGPGPRP